MVQPLDIELQTRFTRVNRENLTEKVVAQIKGLILSKGIPIGQRLPSERLLASRFGVSRAVTREALKSLEQSGLVEIRTGATGGAFVVNNHHIPLFQVSYDLFSSGRLTLSHFYEARKAIECSMIRLVVLKATDKDIERLSELNSQLLDEQTDPREQGQNNDTFHVALAKISGNPLMVLIVQSLMTLLRRVFTGWDRERTHDAMLDMYKRHREIIEAIQSRDVTLCERLIAVDTEYIRKLAVQPCVSPPRNES